ncbi:MAG: hypothetical protein AAF985_05935 [Bacteroidota bacterium]
MPEAAVERKWETYFWVELGAVFESLDESSDHESGGEILIFIVLIIAILILACGSALIPHFWVIAMIINLRMIAMLVYRENCYEAGRGASKLQGVAETRGAE